MRHIKLIQERIPFSVNKFEEKTNKKYPYYQKGSKYALCPACGSSVRIIGGSNNSTHSQKDTGTIYAAHTQNAISGLPYDEHLKINCLNYEGNKNNWQRIYKKQNNTEENRDVEEYIEENKNEIARDLENIIGFKCAYRKGQSALFEKIYESFKKNRGLYIPSNHFVPEYIPRLLIEKADPVTCWGAIISNEKVKGLIEKNKQFIGTIDKDGQFKPRIKTRLVGTLNNDNEPTRILIKLIYDHVNELIINKIPTKIK